MKMKKLFAVISMLAVMFSLAGCEKKNEKPFDYDDTQIVYNTMQLFYQYSHVSDEYSSYYINSGSAFEQSAVKGIKQAVETDKVGEFEDFMPYFYNYDGSPISGEQIDYEITNAEDSVSVTVVNHAENRDVEITVKYVENPLYYIELDQMMMSLTPEQIETQLQMMGYTVEEYLSLVGYSSIDQLIEEQLSMAESQLQQREVYRYLPEEMVVSAVYSKGELMKQAGMNTLIGMGTVFVVLIFISFIISLFKFLPALFAKKPTVPMPKEEAPAAKAAPVPAPARAAKDSNLVNDAELVAVITAAIYAAEGMTGSQAVSRDKLVVRSIRRAKKNR